VATGLAATAATASPGEPQEAATRADSVTAQEARVSYSGFAFDLQTGAYLYSETHTETVRRGGPIRCEVVYADAEEEPIARKEIDFGTRPWTPSFRMEDERDGYVEGAEVYEDSVRLYTRERSSEPFRERTLLISSERPLVIDAGFNPFVRHFMSTMKPGDRVVFDFTAPHKLRTYRLRLRLTEETVFQGRQAAVFHLEVDNFLVRLFVDPIVLAYDIETRRILQYEGVTNVGNGSGKNYVARILFPDHYAPAVAQAGSGKDGAAVLQFVDRWWAGPTREPGADVIEGIR
jgi:hypothetical protein